MRVGPAGAGIIWATVPCPRNARNISLLLLKVWKRACSLASRVTLTGFRPSLTVAAIGLHSLLNSLLSGHPFLRGTLCAFIGFAFIALYYRHARHKLRKAAKPPSDLVRLEFPGRQDWPKLRYLQIGAPLFVAVFVLPGAAHMAK